MRKGIAWIGAASALALFAGAAIADEACLRKNERLALKMAAVQEQLMVAALSCRAVERYNSFVTVYRPELQSADDGVKAFFLRSGSLADYHAFKTRLANASSLSSVGDAGGYCRDALAEFDMALAPDHGRLRDFLAVQMAPESAAADCAEDVMMAARDPREANRPQGLSGPVLR